WLAWARLTGDIRYFLAMSESVSPCSTLWARHQMRLSGGMEATERSKASLVPAGRLRTNWELFAGVVQRRRLGFKRTKSSTGRSISCATSRRSVGAATTTCSGARGGSGATSKPYVLGSLAINAVARKIGT